MPLEMQPFRTTEITQPRIKDWFTNSQPDFTQELITEEDAEQFEHEEGINKVYLFSTKKATPPIYQALAANFNNRLRFAVVKKQNPIWEVLAHDFEVDKWPTLLVHVQNGADKAGNIVYDGKLKLPDLKAFVAEYALSPENAKEDYTITSKKRKEAATAQRLEGLRIVEDIDEMKSLIMDEPNAALVYAAQRDQAPHLSMVEELGAKYGQYINIIALIVDEPSAAKKELKGKLPLFRFYKNELKGQAKRDTSFEILIPDRLSPERDLDKIEKVIVEEMEENFEHEVKIVTETVFYQKARPVTHDEGKNAIAWLYNTENDIGIPFLYKALSMD